MKKQNVDGMPDMTAQAELEPDTQKLKEMLERDKQLRAEECLKELNAVLAKHRCKLVVRKVEIDGQVAEIGSVIVALD